jgi:hypothetical protein
MLSSNHHTAHFTTSRALHHQKSNNLLMEISAANTLAKSVQLTPLPWRHARGNVDTVHSSSVKIPHTKRVEHQECTGFKTDVLDNYSARA